jgi:acetoacetyl-CoA synthetase
MVTPSPVSVDIPLYRPSKPEASATFRFLNRVNFKFSLSLASYHDLYIWSIAHIDDFWSAVWDETGVIGHKGNHVVDATALPCANPPWFGFRRSGPEIKEAHYITS